MKRLRLVKAFIYVERLLRKTAHNLPRTILHYLVYARSRETENLLTKDLEKTRQRLKNSQKNKARQG